MFGFIFFEVLVLVACIFIAKKMVEKRNGLTRFIPIAVDDEQAIEKMKNIVREIVQTGHFVMSREYDGYEIELKAKENCIGEVVIKSPATKVSYDFMDGFQTESRAYSEKGAVVQIALILWIITICIQVVVGVIALLVWLHSLIN